MRTHDHRRLHPPRSRRPGPPSGRDPRPDQDLRPRPRSTASTSPSATARSPASSARTAPGSPRPSASCSACCAPTPARARLLGGDPWRDAVALHRRLAYVPGDVTLWPNLTGGEAIDLLARLRGRPRPRRARPSCWSASSSTRRKKARTYSKGNRQKVALVAAFASDVELLVLDEPTSGLDPLMEAVFTECVREAKAAGTSVLLSQPHPRRGREALRHRDDHPRRPHGGVRHPRRAAAPDPLHGSPSSSTETRPALAALRRRARPGRDGPTGHASPSPSTTTRPGARAAARSRPSASAP